MDVLHEFNEDKRSAGKYSVNITPGHLSLQWPWFPLPLHISVILPETQSLQSYSFIDKTDRDVIQTSLKQLLFITL